MYCLALDTSSIASSAALYNIKDDKPLASSIKIFDGKKKGHSENLLIQVGEIMQKAQLHFEALSSIMVTIGPGSFTGIRVALSAARSINLPLKVKMIPINCLQAIAANHLFNCSFNIETAAKGAENSIAVIIDAKRDQSYFQLFDKYLNELSKPDLLENNIIFNKISSTDKNITLLTNQDVILSSNELISSEFISFSKAKTYPVSKNFVRLANSLKPCKEPPSPLYIRKPDAKKPKLTNYLSSQVC